MAASSEVIQPAFHSPTVCSSAFFTVSPCVQVMLDRAECVPGKTVLTKFFDEAKFAKGELNAI